MAGELEKMGISHTLEYGQGSVVAEVGSEDFGWYLTKAPGLMFRFGTRNEALDRTGVAHQSDFKVDESGMESTIRVFIACAMQ